MDQDFGTPIPPLDSMPAQPQKKNNTVLIIVIVLVVLCCCCVVVGGGLGYWLYNNGDDLLNSMGALLPMLTV
jgi:hypothetical protein